MADSVALTALVVSLIALLATAGQLLQQYFATADGFRRCQPSVMGFWAKKTRLRWRWREFRFETMFAVPRIIYGPVHSGTGKDTEIAGGNCSLVDTDESLRASMTYPGWSSFGARRYYSSDELACWIPLLAQLHAQGRETVKFFPQKPGAVENSTMVPVIQIVQKSWDFMPLDVVRPMASSTVSAVAIMGRRLGMTWKSFDPGSGSMRAEGNGHIITSTMARSLGTILQYSFTSRENAGNCCYIPVREADKLGFGLVEFDHRLFGPTMPGDLDVGSYYGIAKTLWLITGTHIRDSNPSGNGSALRDLSREMKSQSDFIPGLNDLVPLCSAMLSVTPPTSKDRWLNRIPAPNLYLKGVTSSMEGFRVFESRLRDLVDERLDLASSQSKHVLCCLSELREDFASRWENEQDWEHWDYHMGDEQDKEMRAKGIVMRYHTEMTVFLRDSNVIYRTLVGEHALMAIGSMSGQSTSTGSMSGYTNFERELLARYGLDENCSIELVRSMHNYFQGLSDVAQKVIEKCHRSKPDQELSVIEVEDAWFCMMFRAFCWQRSHSIIPDVAPLPSEYWNSKMPVYIG